MPKYVLVFVLALSLGLSGHANAQLHKKLDGIWVSDLLTVEIDFAKATYTGVAMGQPFDRKLTLVKEFGNAVIFKADEATVTAQFQEDGSVMLAKDGGIPMIVKRMN